MSDALEPDVLLLASRFDLAVDFVVAKLQDRGASYLRINSEDFLDGQFAFDSSASRLRCDFGGRRTVVGPMGPGSVFFRRPVFLRQYGLDGRSPEEQALRVQWAAFLRNLMVFNDAHWVNHPAAIYRAEHKLVQLQLARACGFSVPRTVVTNCVAHVLGAFKGDEEVALKGIDTVLVRYGDEEAFGFTTFALVGEIAKMQGSFAPAPVLVQERLRRKQDIRVTVVGGVMHAAAVNGPAGPTDADWRTLKAAATFARHELPADVQRRCRQILDELGLVYGAIDLALVDGIYWFLEVNPTGEWAWLVDAAGLPLDDEIAKHLADHGRNGTAETVLY